MSDQNNSSSEKKDKDPKKDKAVMNTGTENASKEATKTTTWKR